MEDLYLETESGKERIEGQTAEKYNLEAGTLSPFTRSRIVGKDGKYALEEKTDEDSESSIRRDFSDMPFQGIPDDGIDQMDNGFELSQSEIIDFSQGVDSRMDENK